MVASLVTPLHVSIARHRMLSIFHQPLRSMDSILPIFVNVIAPHNRHGFRFLLTASRMFPAQINTRWQRVRIVGGDDFRRGNALFSSARYVPVSLRLDNIIRTRLQSEQQFGRTFEDDRSWRFGSISAAQICSNNSTRSTRSGRSSSTMVILCGGKHRSMDALVAGTLSGALGRSALAQVVVVLGEQGSTASGLPGRLDRHRTHQFLRLGSGFVRLATARMGREERGRQDDRSCCRHRRGTQLHGRRTRRIASSRCAENKMLPRLEGKNVILCQHGLAGGQDFPLQKGVGVIVTLSSRGFHRSFVEGGQRSGPGHCGHGCDSQRRHLRWFVNLEHSTWRSIFDVDGLVRWRPNQRGWTSNQFARWHISTD